MQDYLRVQLEFLYVVAYRQHFELMLIFTLSLEFCHSYMPFRTPRDTLALCPRTCSFGWCLVEGYRNGDQRRPMGICGSGRTLALALYAVIYHLTVYDHSLSLCT